MAAWLSQRSTILSTFSASAINYSTLSGSAITLNSTMISLGTSTNSVYTRLSQGNFNSSVSTSSWVSSLTGRVSTTTVAMSANAQYQLALSQSSISTSVMFTSTLGSSWSTLSGATGLPNYSTISYTAGAVSGTGQYGVLGTSAGNLYTTSTFGQSWANTNSNTPAIYLPFETIPVDGPIGGTTLTVTGSPGLVAGIVGTNAVNLANAAPGGTPTRYIRGTWNNIGLTSYTISFWVNIQSYGSAQNYIFSAYNAALSVQTAAGSNNLTATIPIAASPNYASFTIPNYTVLPVNTWHNITIIYQSAGTCYFYLNNALYGTIAGAGLFAQGTSGLFSLASFDNSVNNAFNGYIDDLKIYNYAIFTLPSPLSLTYSSVAVSNTGQYMLATVTNGGLFMSSNFGSTWSQVTGAMLSAIWSNAQVSATGQYMLVNAQPQIVQPQLTGLTAASWQVNGITWTASASTNSSFSYNMFDNITSNRWYGAPNTYNTAGNTSGITMSIIGIGTVTGDWVQLQSSVPLVMTSYQFATGAITARLVKTYYIAGSNDGINWYPIQYGSGGAVTTTAVNTLVPGLIIANSASTQTFGSSTITTTTYSTTTNAYLYFRLVCLTTYTVSPTLDFIDIGEWFINFQTGGQTYSTNYGATWSNQPALYSQQTLMPGPTAASITYPSTTLALSESGQYALSATVSNPVLLGQLNFEGTYADSTGGNTLVSPANGGNGTAVTLSTDQKKVGTQSLYIPNTAGTGNPLSYQSYSLQSTTFFNTAPAYSMSAWIYPTALPTSGNIAICIAINNGGLAISSNIYINSNGTMAMQYYTSGESRTLKSITSFNTISANTWSHVVGIFASGTSYLYINGIMSASATYTGIPCTFGGFVPAALFLGCGGYFGGSGAGGYAGYIDDFRIYNSALTPQQIQTIYANNVSSTTLTQIVPSFSVSPQQTGITANIWNQSGVTWTSSVSSAVNSNYPAWATFNNTVPNSATGIYSWASMPNYALAGTYNGSVTTPISGISPNPMPGEWLQIQSSVPLVMYSYNFAAGGISNIPKSYYIIGSNDGITWNPIQYVTIGATNPFTTNFSNAISSNIIVNQSGTQTMNGGNSATLTCTTYTTNTTAAYTYFRIVANTVFGAVSGAVYFELEEWFLTFTGPTNTSLYNIVSPLTGLSTNTYTSGTIPGVITNSAISNTGQYMALITNNVSGNNVYYSMNYGATFTGLQLGTSVLTSCAMSYDGSYITIASGATVYTLNNNSTGFSLALGNQAGYQNQANNAIAIGNYAGYQNQAAGSIILNASGPGALGTGLNAVAQGFYVAPIASYTASASQTFSILGYGTDNQVVQTALASTSGNLIVPSGNLGVGTNAPGWALHIEGVIPMSGISGRWGQLNQYMPAQLVINNLPMGQRLYIGSYYTGNAGQVSVLQGSGIWDGTDHPTAISINPNGGNVGIGATNLASVVHFVIPSTTPVGSGNVFTIATGGGSSNSQRLYIGNYDTGSVPGSASYTFINASYYGYAYNNVCLQTDGGRVGIGKTNPSQLLDVNGAINCTSFLVNGTAVATGTGSVWGVNGSIAYYTSGNVGIGTISPTNLLTLGAAALPIANSAGTTNLVVHGNINCYRNRLIFSSVVTDWNHCIYNNTQNLDNEGAWDGMKFNVYNGALFRVGNANGAIPTTALFIDSAGNVGIKTNSPSATLEVVGSGVGGAPLRLVSNSAGNEVAIGWYRNPDRSAPTIGDVWVTGVSTYGVGDRNFGIGCNTTNLIMSMLANGNVGIGITNPTSKLQVFGSLAKSSGTFDIAHPLHPTTKRLVHSFIEGPRCDLIYRGTVALTNGVATVDINRQCTHNTVGAMEHGTFEALCANPDVFLQNRTGFGRVIGTIQGAILTITCENNTATDLISWMVVAERADPFIKQWDRTDNDGYLITEYSQ